MLYQSDVTKKVFKLNQKKKKKPKMREKEMNR